MTMKKKVTKKTMVQLGRVARMQEEIKCILSDIETEYDIELIDDPDNDWTFSMWLDANADLFTRKQSVELLESYIKWRDEPAKEDDEG
jgi:hypothetical protein